jgi:hypothetical protein
VADKALTFAQRFVAPDGSPGPEARPAAAV